MAYKPVVVNAKMVSHNEKNGLFEVVAELKDRTVCRLTYEKSENGEHVVTTINRLLKEPCPICRKDFLCKCMDRYINDISSQSLEQTGTP